MTRSRRTSLLYRTLTASFLRRFFENEITGGREDLKLSFFWLLAGFTAPLTLLPVSLMVHYQSILVRYGPEALREQSRPGKVLAITLGMAAAGLVAAVVWNSLMLERRDGLVLGVLPIRGRDIVLSKLAALAIYVLGIAVSMHGISSVLFGLILGDGAPSAWFAVMSPVAHFTATVASAAFVFLSVAALQGLALALAGSGVHRRISTAFQVALAAGVVLSVTYVSHVTRAVALLDQWSPEVPVAPWLLWAPPVWFLGLYEWMLGNAEPVYTLLAQRAFAALAIVTTTTLATYVVVYRRVMTRVAETPEDGGGGWVGFGVVERITRRLSRDPVGRAAIQFFWSSLGRVARLRFVVATTIGLLCAWTVPALAVLAVTPPSSPRSTFALSYAALILSLLGLRVAISMPADLGASWIVAATDARAPLLRSGLWRALFLTAVLPLVALSAALHAWLWDARTALMHAVIMTTAGTLAVEAALWHFDDLPFRRPWRPENANLRLWWSAYALGFSGITGALPQVEWLARDSLIGHAAIAGAFLTAAVLLRIAHARPYPAPEIEIETFVESPHVLKLD